MGSLFKSTINTRFLEESHKYIRSDRLINLSNDEIQWLKDNNFKLIVDLRNDEEIKEKPCNIAFDPFFIYKHMSVKEGIHIPKTKEEVIESYISMNTKETDNIVNTIINSSSNVCFFCSMGKDRTGIISALILRKLGYNNKYIIDNYMESYDNCIELLNKILKDSNIYKDCLIPDRLYIEKFLEDLNNKEEIL